MIHGYRRFSVKFLCSCTWRLMVQELKIQKGVIQNFMDYTAVPAGWLIKGHLWTGQSTKSTVSCPKCGRIGVLSSVGKHQRVVVHRSEEHTSELQSRLHLVCR